MQDNGKRKLLQKEIRAKNRLREADVSIGCPCQLESNGRVGVHEESVRLPETRLMFRGPSVARRDATVKGSF
jgi:hypothetical protein